jgi:thiamine pyrophosphate-dependent acetolactate synthase large subunit-like protein
MSGDMTTRTSRLSSRRAAVARILRDRGNALVVTGLGSPTYDVAAAGDTPLNFYLWAGMGGAAMMGLGLALAQPERRVLVVTGDGEMLMGLGSLATIGVRRPGNLAIVVVDNEHYGETGMQPTHTGRGVDLAGIALAAGFPQAVTVRAEHELDALGPKLLADRGPLLAVLKVSTDPTPISLPPRDGPYLRSRFREALLGPDAHR